MISYAFITKRVLHSRRYFFTSSTIPFMLLAKKARWLYWHEEGNIPKNGILQKQESLVPQILLPGSSLEKILLLKSCIMFLSSTSCCFFFYPFTRTTRRELPLKCHIFSKRHTANVDFKNCHHFGCYDCSSLSGHWRAALPSVTTRQALRTGFWQY